MANDRPSDHNRIARTGDPFVRRAAEARGPLSEVPATNVNPADEDERPSADEEGAPTYAARRRTATSWDVIDVRDGRVVSSGSERWALSWVNGRTE